MFWVGCISGEVVWLHYIISLEGYYTDMSSFPSFLPTQERERERENRMRRGEEKEEEEKGAELLFTKLYKVPRKLVNFWYFY